MSSKADQVVSNFTYHTPKNDQPQRYTQLRAAGLQLAEMVLEKCPESREQSLALTKIEEAKHWALHRKQLRPSKSQMFLCLKNLPFLCRNGRSFSSMQLRTGKT